MKSKNPLALLFGWLALGAAPESAIHAADSASAAVAQQTGSITGRVQNVVTGQYLNNARVTLKGTDRVAFTDEFGVFRINQVRSGPAVLEVFYTDLDLQEITVDVPAGGVAERNVELTSVARYGQNAKVVKLNPFVVASNRDTNAEAIATNEQRFSPNIKNVMSTDALGVVMVGGVGEFMKFIPGVTTTDGGGGVSQIAIRGISSAMTNYSMDGAEMVNATNGNTRSFSMQNLSLNDISRMEITKVPTPAMAADSLGGSVNMIRKTAFEQEGDELMIGVTFLGNSENLTLKKTPVSLGDKNVYKFIPGLELQYTKLLNKNLGLVLTWSNGNRPTETHISRNTYVTTPAPGIDASFSRPYLQNYLLVDAPQNRTSKNAGLKVDWRITPHSVLSVGGTFNTLLQELGNLQFNPTVGANGTPATAGGVPLSFGPDFTIGAAGRGGVNISNINQSIEGELFGLDAKYRFDDGTWRFEASANGSSSFWARRNFKHGHMQALNTALVAPARITFSSVHATRPGVIQAFDANNREIDLYDINSYRVTTATDVPLDASAAMRAGQVSLRRQIDALAFPTAIQIGGAYKRRTQDTETRTRSFNYNGPDGNAATTADQGAAALAMQIYVNQDSHYGFRNLPYVSSTRAFEAWEANPNLFSQTPAQIVAEENTRLTNSEYLEEAVTSSYLQVESSLLDRRLRVLGGVRYERTQNRGQGSLFDPNAVFARNADGTFARNAQGARIRRTDAGAVGSLEELKLTRKERAAHSERNYGDYYPSLHFTYSIKENLLARLAYARTYGRPDFAEITPRTVIQEADLSNVPVGDPSIVRGTLMARNPGLKPWTADNFDLSVEYYSDQGGLFSAGVFDKQVKNFFGTSTRLATEDDLEAVGLGLEYVGWELTSNINTGDARILGAEFNFRHSLRGIDALGSWANYFTVFANATRLRLKGNRGASFTSFVPKIINAGATFNRKRLSVTVRWNHHGKDKRAAAPTFGPDGYDYFKPRTTMDLSFTYQISRRFSISGSAINVLNAQRNWLRYSSETPEYAQQFQESEYGAYLALGVKARF